MCDVIKSYEENLIRKVVKKELRIEGVDETNCNVHHRVTYSDSLSSIKEGSSKPKYAVDITVPFRNDFVIGENYPVNLPSRNINRTLRLMEATYDVQGVKLTFEEDTGTFEDANAN